MNAPPSLSFDLLADLRQLTVFPFMVNALEAGTIVAVLAAVVGWYVVLRRQTFTSHTLSVMAFPGASGAALVGLPVSLGYYLACGIAALAIGRSSGRSGARSGADSGGRSRQGYGGETATIGTIQTVGLAAGFVFLSLNRSVLSGPETLLFGTFLGVTRAQVLVLLAVAVVALAGLVALGRPLLYATIDPELARASGVPVGVIDLVFLLILASAIAATSQITGALLVFALLVAPPACAQEVTLRPLAGLGLSIGFALVISWLALGIAYFTIYPVGFMVTSIAFAMYVLVRACRWRSDRRR